MKTCFLFPQGLMLLATPAYFKLVFINMTLEFQFLENKDINGPIENDERIYT